MMFKLIILVFSLVGLINVCVGQIVQEGQCDGLALDENFDISEFLGKWFEIARTSNPNQEGDCAAFDFTSGNNGIDVQYTAVRSNFFEEATGMMTQEGDTAEFKMTISSFEEPVDFWVLELFEPMFAVTYSCQNISPTHRKVYVWVLGRQTTLNDINLGRVMHLLNENFGINYSELTNIDHNDSACYALPIIEPGNPIILPGQCDESLQVLPNFNATAFSGLWHQISSYENSNSDGTCVRAEYSLGNEGVNILNSQVINQRLVTIEGSATIISNDNSAKLQVVLNTPGGPSTPQELWILASDYDHYAVLYACTDINLNEKRVLSWILGRSRQLSQVDQSAVNDVVNSHIELNYRYYKPTDQSFDGCFFYPEASDQPVVFRGQCESVNVQAMSDFKTNEYMNKWHNILSYPTRFQDGTCVNAYYTLTNDGVNVLNSQVNDQRLETMSGVAVPSSNDGSAKLVVSFPVAGSDQTTSTDYWVLDTDYNNFALVYSCKNINDDEMQVNSWLLSRTKSMPIEQEQRINEKINSVLVLDEKYYKVENQSEVGCFYFPDPQPGVPVIFPGQCDETINVVQTLDLSEFQGEWYEIEAYPNAQQSGHCRNQKFSVVDNSRLNLEFSSITDQFLQVTKLVATQSTNDGKLSITVTDANGQVTNIPFWILDIKYNDYALAYSCVNINSDFRSVKSWKLSRTRQLSEEANTAINTIINNNIVLGNEYFEVIDHSDEACFYLPEIEAGEPIILPGQCDTTIGGILDFNITAYAGRWRLIESYGSEFQGGTCNVVEYTLQSENSFNVINSQVVNENLESITATASVASNDGSGHLRLSFPNRDEYFDFYVLDTNYWSYAIGYGCVNLANHQRRIYSWKLSRTDTLSPEATIKINAVIDNVQVLNNRYYYQIDRTAKSCFYYPIPNPNSSVKFRGQCDQNIVVHNGFQLEKYLGVWYDIQSYPSDFQDGTCNTAEYSQGNNGVHVYNTQVVDQTLVSISGNAVLEPSNDGSAKLKVTFNVAGTDVTTDYWILKTDYDHYSLVYSCRPIDDEYIQVTSWKLSREKFLRPEDEIAINDAMNEIKVLDQKYFVNRYQSPVACFYFPEPQPGVPVVFPGQCNDYIPAAPNFNINEFAGTWHEISAYPKASQSGQCISQQFTVTNANTMKLESFSVLDQFQTTTEGVATIDSTDGSGRLNINIQSNGQTISIPFWILSVKYDDYALAYSCVNIDKNYRQVHSWKLSRSRELSNTGNAAINDAITNIDVIDNRYFDNTDQSDEACFHLPDLAPGEDVVLPGRCDTTIKGIDDFNITAYAGQWRLIESYGSRYQSGTCNVADYVLQSSNTLGITNSQVVDEALATISGTATISSTDGTGQLTFNMRNREYVMLVLATDYTSFALTYGCQNIDNDRRRVRSWKFSRYNTLTTNAINEIDKVIEDIEVLHQPYYYKVERTPAACFYFPEPNPSSNVIFRGQCEQQKIAVVENFKIEEYMDMWYDIQSYPSAFQDGTCPNARYTLTGNTVSVHNTHVVDQTLVTIDGVATPASTDGSGKLKVTFNVQNTEVTTDYWVLATNYKSYALVYSCTNINEDYMSVSSWKLSREKFLRPEDEIAINDVMNEIKVLDQKYFVNRYQIPEACFYFPEPQPGVPVVFPGQCNDYIPAAPNFNINEFAGTWHEISAYPKASQSGQCISQQITVTNANTMKLESFSVLDQFQTTTEGVATIDSTDGSGRLNINIQSNGQTISIPFWILSVKYDDYALAYSCVNIDKNYRQVHSWKLSKTTTLNEDAQAQINVKLDEIQVLKQKYYVERKHTEDDCFYYPNNDGGPVLLGGQCISDAQVPAVTGFISSKFAETWHEVARFPSELQNGECTATEFTLVDGSFDVVQTSVIDDAQLSTVTTGTLATDGRGVININIDGVPFNNVYILLTDYEEYALAYSCRNVSPEEKQIYSWILSRSRAGLTESAQLAIQEHISNNIDLYEGYYQTTKQDNAACFYYPVFDQLPLSIELPGPCDASIKGISGFNQAAFSGKWIEVARYPQPIQRGQCNRAEYNNNGEIISIVATQVVDRKLQTSPGNAKIASSDGSGLLEVSLGGGDDIVEAKLYVLATDYSNYALLYNCIDLDNGNRRVGSWKLSRSGTLSPQDTEFIDEVIDNTQGLRNNYYLDTDQSDEACFHYPEPSESEVILPGQCDETISGVASFDMEQFQGTWYQIERYDAVQTSCIGMKLTYNADSNEFGVLSYEVSDGELSTAKGTGRLSPDGTGKLSVAMSEEGSETTIFILSTDYESYAVAYSCSNLSGSQRRVRAWQLSRERTILPAGATAIANLIEQRKEFHQPYFKSIAHDNECLEPSSALLFKSSIIVIFVCSLLQLLL
ncbi:uncharacterized protein LOC118275267 isoform X3 [Spodoptera frugiperda]|uniref:Uncharacterized protein LOC118275267 isoform X3 n=1 Tax=Spodoptera frugiperda TaxID=7108 RepID=A0A9R0DQA6_SPOFR|nr:uncharacterized protein LOC118275267 isoform X3 [Spodoptera frugiperda]